ncbi:MAG: long-chain-fatty-acid--CoA ligase [Rhodospirillaceae bacterium]
MSEIDFERRHFKVWPKGRPFTLTRPETTLVENLEIAARRTPGQVAIHYYGSAITYADLKRDVDALAGYLQSALGVAKGDRVILDMQNAPQFVVAFYAVLRADAVVVPVNPMMRADELEHVVADTEARVAVIGQELEALFEPILATGALRHAVVAAYSDALQGPTDLKLPDVVAAPARAPVATGAVAWMDALAKNLAPRPAEARADDWSVLPYSSGTTGRPKGCLHTHRSAGATVFAYANWYTYPPCSVTLVSLPFFHVTAMQNAMNTTIFAAATMVIMTRWDRAVAAELIRRHRVTHWRFITATAIDFFSDPGLGTFDLSSLVAIGGGGAQMPEVLALTIKDLTGLDYVEGYGLTETMAASHINPNEAPKPQCLGIPIFDVDSRIVDPETLAELGPEQTGEIVIAAPQLFTEYWRQPEATRDAFIEIDGKRFFRTGDLGYYDYDGYFFFVDRLKRMINASGYKVWPAEVEAMMQGHPAIKEVCIIAAPDAKRGETVKAVIVAKPGHTPDADAIEDWCRHRMAAYKVPRLYQFTDDLPRSTSGKVLWRELQARERGG